MTIESARWYRDKALGIRLTDGELKALKELKNLDPRAIRINLSTWVRGVLMDMAAEKGINRREVLKKAIEGGEGSLGGKQFPGIYEIHPDGTEYRVLPDGSISLQVYPVDLEQRKEDEELAQQKELFNSSPGEVVEFRRRHAAASGIEEDQEIRVLHPFEAQDELDRKRLRRRRVEAGLDPDTGESPESPTSGWAAIDDASSHMDDDDLLALFDGDNSVLKKYDAKETVEE